MQVIPPVGPDPEDAKRVKEVLLEIQAAAFGHAAAYTSVIMFGGYAGLFAIWTLTKEHMEKNTAYTVGLLLGISLLTFVLFEIFGMIVRSVQFYRMRGLMTGDLSPADFLAEHKRVSQSNWALIQWLVIPVWIVAFAVSVFTGIGSAFLLLWTFSATLL